MPPLVAWSPAQQSEHEQEHEHDSPTSEFGFKARLFLLKARSLAQTGMSNLAPVEWLKSIARVLPGRRRAGAIIVGPFADGLEQFTAIVRDFTFL